MNDIFGNKRYPCVDCCGTGLVLPERNKYCPYCNGLGNITEDEFLAANQRMGIPVSRLIVNGADLGLVIDFPEDEE